MKIDYNALCDEIGAMLQERDDLIIAIDGGSCSGKTTMAAKLHEKYGGNVFHMDDFYLRPEQRTPERYDEPGGNVDRERFLDEILSPLSQKQAFTYRPFDCHSMRLKDSVAVTPSRLNIIEGSYSLHPDLTKYYDLKVWLNIGRDLQSARVTIREGSNARMFLMKWIPLEERYRFALSPQKRADFEIDIR